MKRIINGVTYNTDTARIVARWEYEDQDGYPTDATLYQTRGGALFIVHQWEVDKTPKVYFEPASRDQILRLVERTDNLEIVDESVLQDPPEAAIEAEPGATLYIRIPASLKTQLEEQANHERISLNTWTMRCVERCAQRDEVGARLGEIMQTIISSNSGAVVSDLEDHIYEQAKAIAEILGWHGKELEDLSTNAMVSASYGDDIHRHWRLPDEDAEEENHKKSAGADVTGRDRAIIIKALATAHAAIDSLPHKGQNVQDRHDIALLLRHYLGADWKTKAHQHRSMLSE